MVPARLGEAADAMVEVCAMRVMCLISTQESKFDTKFYGKVLTVAASFIIYSCQIVIKILQ